MIGNLVLVRTRRQYTLASTFLRFQEYYENPKFRGEIFLLEEFMDWYAVRFGNFTYYQDWAGFNIPSSVLKPFRKGKFNPLSKKEKRLLGLLADMSEPFYVVGIYDEKLGLRTLKHELVHGLYYTVPEYRKGVQKILGPEKIRRLAEVFKKMGYHRSVWTDEANAYLMVGARSLSEDGLRWTRELRKLEIQIQKIFRTHFGFSLQRANKVQVLKFFHSIKL